MTSRTATVRCAIYTRKSSEEGLDQAFNSLHAQRQACEAYIVSQAGEGWIAQPELYDDGGFSGGTIDRPALKRLLSEIDAGRIDTVVVYKIDRLTRSLTDFAKIVDRLDAAGTSFVSVTQAFNTTTSMGRLTLNVLLSFAQFEREVTGERIRDKIAASKAKGMWMGGTLPLGYDRPTDLATRALVVNPAEADAVRQIFERYLELASVSELDRWLDDRGIRSKRYISLNGKEIGGARLGRGAIFHLLKNRVYLGEIRHKDQTFPGAHPAIIDNDLFDAVQFSLGRNAQAYATRTTRVGQALLKGLIFDTDGHPMSPTFARGRGGAPYRYYVSTPLQRGQSLPRDESIRRVPAHAVEDVVFHRLGRLSRRECEQPSQLLCARVLKRVEIHATTVHLLLDLPLLTSEASIGALRLERLRARLAPGEDLAIEVAASNIVRVSLPVRMAVRGGRTWVMTPDGRNTLPRQKVDQTLLRGLRSAHAFARDIGHYGDLGITAAAPARTYDRNLSLLAFLAPDIQKAIVEGRQPANLNLQRLLQPGLPLSWAEQRATLGF